MATKKRVAQILIDVLSEAGAKHCYGVVGDTLNYVTEAIYHSDIEWIHVRHEEAGAFAAGAEAFVSDRLTVCAGSCGPGSLHFINGIYEANRNGAPVVLIASQLATDTLGSDFPQEVDFVSVYQSCSVFCQQVINPQSARRVFTEAVQTAINKRGVAVIILPVDISKAEVEDRNIVVPKQTASALTPTQDELQQVAALLAKGGNIGIYAGIGCRYCHDELVTLAQALKAPIAHTSRAKDFIEYDNPYNVGMTGMFGTKGGFEMIKSCDTLLVLGCGFAWSQFYPDNATIIQVDHDATRIGLRHPVDFGLVADVKATLQALIPLLIPRQERTFLDKYVELYQKAVAKLDKKMVVSSHQLIHPQYLVDLLDHYADDDAIFTADVGSAMVWLSRHIHVNGKRRTLSSLKHGSMANAMPQALGLQKAYPDRQVISISGDGGLAMLLGDLLTAVQEQLPIKIAVLNNHSLNFVELEQKQEGLVERYTDLTNPNLAKIAESIGFGAWQITDANELENAVQEFLAYDGPAFLDVHTSANELIMPPTITLENVKGMALYSAKATLEGKGLDFIDLIKDNFLKK
ncbi:pyruvate dehydrogenase (quinone) [Orbus hercynius]|uniref:Pyruvate dehydrogenase (Quinone) n=1 Tax=Orbus hercynius TaxID=593135 RepID=A0A495RCH2_9GAMM|nr:thiamine pyrophosphate-dependent enzyme [Orbus hercynius]RKS85041.1 pyruvate dehydrogenase (quinone) [Orbus hercynius]